MESDHQQPLNNDSTDVVKVILKLNQRVENHEPQRDELEYLEVMVFNNFPLAIKHQSLQASFEASFSIQCYMFHYYACTS
jgi:hypothetical protein